MTKLNKHIRIFISSTFRDMQKEREILVKKVFPKIRTYARQRLVEFIKNKYHKDNDSKKIFQSI